MQIVIMWLLLQNKPHNPMKNLYFDYPSGSKIRFKKGNCLIHDDYPLIYRIKTKKLDFVIPRKMTLFSDKYVFIPLDYYRNVLTQHYLLWTIK